MTKFGHKEEWIATYASTNIVIWPTQTIQLIPFCWSKVYGTIVTLSCPIIVEPVSIPGLNPQWEQERQRY